jgi:TonB-dependent SusC/RagA subfamily outer membrane receptor
MKKLILLVLAIHSFGQAQKPIFVTAKTNAATVYFNSAELSQSTTVLLPKGTSEIVVKNIADNLNQNTIQIGAPANVTVLSVQFSNDYISEFEIDEKNPVIKKVRDSIKIIEKEIQNTTNAKDSEAKTIELLDKNQQVWGNNNGLNVAELTKMVLYYKQTRTEANNTFDALGEKVEKLNVQLANLQNKLETSTKTADKSSKGKLILQVMNDVAGSTDLNINYIINSATWKPFYDLRANNVTEPINMMYKAEVSQNSGIDWKKVKLTLSSGNPNQNNTAPILSSWFLRYGNLNEKKDYSYREGDLKANTLQSLQGQIAGLNVTGANGQPGSGSSVVIRGINSINANAEPLYVVDGVPTNAETFRQIPQEAIKSVSVLKDASATSVYGNRGKNGVVIITTKQGMDDYTEISENQLNVSFDIDLPYDVLSNGKAHSVALKEIKLPASYKYYAAPRAEKEAFLLAEISDYSKFNLLPGEANIIFEGLYVGKTFINANQTSDTLNLSMGRDKKIAIKREKVVDKSGTKFLSSKKEQTFTFDITVRNNKKETVNLLLKDQYPLSTDKEIETELLESNNAGVNQETGVLTWKLDLKANETRKIRISYKVRYPKDKMLQNL